MLRRTRQNFYSTRGFGGVTSFPCFCEDQVKTILESIKSYTSMTEIRLRGCEVPYDSLNKFLWCLRVLDIRCLENCRKPFNAEGFFYMIKDLGLRIQEEQDLNQDASRIVFPLAFLEFNNGRVSYNAVCAFAKAIHFIRGLEGLTLGWDSLSEDCFPVIARELTLLSHLRFINLTGNHIGNSIESMCESLKDKPLESLVLTHTFLSESGAVIIGRYLQFWPGLIYLDLSENNLGKGMQKLNRGLKNLVKLETLMLADSKLTDKVIAGLPLRNLVQLTVLDISGNQNYGPLWTDALQRMGNRASKISIKSEKHSYLDTRILNHGNASCQF